MTTAREKAEAQMKNVLRVHGPLTCEHTCSMCDGEHHWMEDSVRAEDLDEDKHEDVMNMPEVEEPYLPCKHCKAWAEYPLWWEDGADFVYRSKTVVPRDLESAIRVLEGK